MKALPNIISLYPPFFIDCQLVLTQLHPAKFPLNICCKNPPQIVAIKEITKDNDNIVANITGINNVITNCMNQDTVSPIFGSIRLAKNKNIPCITCLGIDHDFI